ncbi:hypothetical protein H0G86_008167 [Trichoderma simmonsii]|uniref:Uncharacterized protein n=1 Tax=Trichoderma simmonsii TaxID=1491479 RepID=A0A8G0PJ27_9HYPO|nr:hypothetical protein H0G86_008167 [Trichoderma simmonsii]
MHQSGATSKPPEAGEIAKGMVELLAASTPSLDSSTWPYSRSVDDELVCAPPADVQVGTVGVGWVSHQFCNNKGDKVDRVAIPKSPTLPLPWPHWR